MANVAVVVPTTSGREGYYEETVRGWRATTPGVRILTVRDQAGIGPAWLAGTRVALDLDPVVDFVVLAADDAYPTGDEWLGHCISAVRNGLFPSPRILNPDGSLHSCGTLGAGMLLPEVPDQSPAGSSPFPFLKRAWAETLLQNPGPLAAGAHYYSDDYVTYLIRARHHVEAVVTRGYCLLHLEGPPADHVVRASMRDRSVMLKACGDLHERPRP
jgi:hypothetical protein